ncbi:MAG: M23 family metallopeptidase [Roseibium sp.]|uniref:M23 family metallopeptidase n=1 Tax=Roseibium sp. TaxID=1936156 RepID=UPI00261593F0|nr:M23 family metallopeptidase [Roseibium sp.]MCV0426693.1 M23 family metallopeptidase [Roseibium sp.]
MYLYGALALGFLVLGGGIGGLAHLIGSGAISISPPKLADDDTNQSQPDETALVKGDEDGSGAEEIATANGDAEFSGIQEPEFADANDLDVPADPFFDMAVSAVIPLAGDPVLLRDGSASRRIELSERPVPENSGKGAAAAVPTLTAFVLDSEMLDDNGDLVIRAPGSEVDFQFGNFGGGEDTDGITIGDGGDASESQAADLPVFLKPPTDTLNLYLTERPIGQGPSRIEIRTEVSTAISLKKFLSENGFDGDASKPLLEFVESEFGKSNLIAGDKVALRGIRMPNKVGRVGDYYRPVQVSIYSSQGYLGTAAYTLQRQGGSYVRGADPWFGKKIVQEDILNDNKAGAAKTHRLIDGLYATAVRNAVPASIVGEAIAYLAPTTDLKRAIKADERFTLVFTDQPRDEKRGGGKVLFAGVRRGDSWSVRCYVLKAPGNRGFACVNEGGKISLSGAMLVPVKGVLTSKFGMRFHPIKKTERLHAGVDWAAPTGTPIRAAFSGKVSYRDVRGGYGNFVELTHKGGISSRYAHMHEYADGIKLGSVVQAGDIIGYVGTTGLSTGPHLHFEIRQRGEPTDPLAFEMETGADAPQTVASGDLKDYRGTIGEILSTH